MNFARTTSVQSDLAGLRQLERECMERWLKGEGPQWSEHASVVRGWVPWTQRINQKGRWNEAVQR